MKTSQLMTVALPLGSLDIYHASAYGDLTQVYDMGNAWRVQNGMNKKGGRFDSFLKTEPVLAFIEALKKAGIEEPIKVVGRGRSRRTFACLEMLIYTAEVMSPDLHVQVIQTFINSKILEWRDSSGDNFKLLNINIDKLPDRIAKAKEKEIDVSKCNKGCYISIAKMLKEGLNPDGGSWNTASADQLRERTKLEEKVADYIEQGFITSYEQLKDVLHNMLKKV